MIEYDKLKYKLTLHSPPYPFQVVNEDEASHEDDDDTDPSIGKDGSSNMIVDTPESHAVDVPVNEPKTKLPAAEAEEKG
ncbi:hypothetical protein M0R45_017804 [Rubus argutus]|uniref:Uncharacterized protein n=1 Tax=Rubus argutus TaxID=59490 RepID=A0AAW1XYP6_RUBAR